MKSPHKNHAHAFSRREVLLGMAGCAALSGPLERALAGVPDRNRLRGKRVILYTLFGGNDGLNTLVPHRDALYRHLRPNLGLPEATLLPLTDEVALHPEVTELMKLYQAGEVAIVQDVGYPRPNLSHFESMAIWDSGDPVLGSASSTGWYGDVVVGNRAVFDAAGFDAVAITFDENLAFAAGEGVPVLQANQNISAMLHDERTPPAHATASGTPAKLAAIINEGRAVRARLTRRLAAVKPPQWQPYEEPLDIQSEMTQWFWANGVSTPLIRIHQGGFDMHADLLFRHEQALRTFDRGVAKLRRMLISMGAWDDTVILVQSEFGRRPSENGFGGTDHGTAGPVFLIGGKVQGGLYGRRAALDDLDANGNLKFTSDFREVYSTLLSNLWALPVNPFGVKGFAPIPMRLA